jgi:ribonuclease-3
MRKSLSDPSYEQLEWIGDVYLELMASELIAQTFPTLDPGRSSQYREMLIRNSTLGQFSVHYGLDKRANFPAEFGLGGRPNGTKASGKQRVKALGDIFEAYVGAIVRSDPENGMRRAAEWLKVLWGPVLERQIREEEKGTGVKDMKLNPKTQLEQLIVAPGVKIEYRDLPSGGKKDRDTNQDLYFVGCFLNGWGESGLQLGYGQALGKKEAGQKAAVKAMENKKLIKKFSDKKKAFVAARAAQAQVEAEKGTEAAAEAATEKET